MTHVGRRKRMEFEKGMTWTEETGILTNVYNMCNIGDEYSHGRNENWLTESGVSNTLTGWLLDLGWHVVEHTNRMASIFTPWDS